jgi:hypothetical protein
MSKSNPQFLEFHLSFKDMELDYNKFFNSPLDMDFTVHTPDTYSGDHLLNLASTDKKYRERTINELQKVVDLTNSLKKYFKNATRPLIITSVGGFTQNSFITEKERDNLYELVAESLSKVDQDGVEIIPQTLPPLPWYFGGQLYCNLFVTPKDTLEAADYVQDAMTALYYARTVPLQVGQTVAIETFSDGKKYSLEVKVLKKERVTVPAGTFRTLVVEPLLKTPGIFQQTGKIKVWLTDDRLRLPVLMKSRVLIGSISAQLKVFKLGERR